MATDRTCIDAADLGFTAYYEVPSEVYKKLQELSDLMKMSPGAERFAATLGVIVAQIECVLEK